MRLGHLGYAVTSYRAQGVTTDTAHVLVDSSMTRENLYVAMTRGRERNQAYVAVDRPDSLHIGPHPAADGEATARSVLYGVLQNVGAELSAHESLIAEQETWGTIAQLAAEYETIAAAAQRDRWASLLRTSGLSEGEAAAAIESDAFGPLTAELRRAEANHHNVDVLLPRLVRARGFNDADDIAAVLRHRVATATSRTASSGRSRVRPRLIAGLIPEATGAMNTDGISCRCSVRSRPRRGGAPWFADLSAEPIDARGHAAWRRPARVTAAYRDRYQVSTDDALGAPPASTTWKVDRARAESALRPNAAQNQSRNTPRGQSRERVGRTLA